jgi:hypothetical protein
VVADKALEALPAREARAAFLAAVEEAAVARSMELVLELVETAATVKL